MTKKLWLLEMTHMDGQRSFRVYPSKVGAQHVGEAALHRTWMEPIAMFRVYSIDETTQVHEDANE